MQPGLLENTLVALYTVRTFVVYMAPMPETWPALPQRLRSLEQLESLDIAYVNVGTYSMRLHTVRLTELLFLPRLRTLRLLVPGLHDEADAAAFLGANFVRQLREGCLQELDITLLSEDNGKSLHHRRILPLSVCHCRPPTCI